MSSTSSDSQIPKDLAQITSFWTSYEKGQAKDVLLKKETDASGDRVVLEKKSEIKGPLAWLKIWWNKDQYKLDENVDLLKNKIQGIARNFAENSSEAISVQQCSQKYEDFIIGVSDRKFCKKWYNFFTTNEDITKRKVAFTEAHKLYLQWQDSASATETVAATRLSIQALPLEPSSSPTLITSLVNDSTQTEEVARQHLPQGFSGSASQVHEPETSPLAARDVSLMMSPSVDTVASTPTQGVLQSSAHGISFEQPSPDISARQAKLQEARASFTSQKTLASKLGVDKHFITACIEAATSAVSDWKTVTDQVFNERLEKFNTALNDLQGEIVLKKIAAYRTILNQKSDSFPKEELSLIQTTQKMYVSIVLKNLQKLEEEVGKSKKPEDLKRHMDEFESLPASVDENLSKIERLITRFEQRKQDVTTTLGKIKKLLQSISKEIASMKKEVYREEVIRLGENPKYENAPKKLHKKAAERASDSIFEFDDKAKECDKQLARLTRLLSNSVFDPTEGNVRMLQFQPEITGVKPNQRQSSIDGPSDITTIEKEVANLVEVIRKFWEEDMG